MVLSERVAVAGVVHRRRRHSPVPFTLGVDGVDLGLLELVPLERRVDLRGNPHDDIFDTGQQG